MSSEAPEGMGDDTHSSTTPIIIDDEPTHEWSTGDLVWAKLSGFPHWPARISSEEYAPHDILDQIDDANTERMCLVMFFGDLSYSFVQASSCSPFPGKTFGKFKRSSKSKPFRRAIEQAQRVLKGEQQIDESKLAEERRREEEERIRKLKAKRMRANEKKREKNAAKAKKNGDAAKKNAQSKPKAAKPTQSKKKDVATKKKATIKKKKKTGPTFATKARYPHKKESIALKTMRKLGLCPPSAQVCSQYAQYAGFDDRYSRLHKKMIAAA